MKPVTFVALLAASLVSVLSGPAGGHEPPPRGSGVVGLDVYAQGPIVDILLADKTATGVELRHQRSRDGGRTWSESHPIEADAKAARRGDEPQIAATGDRLVAVWTRPGGNRFGKGPFGTALSADGGVTWTMGPNPADDGRDDGHAFADLAADEAGTLFLAWLDSRDGAQGLRTAASRDSGRTWAKNASPDTRSCECCWNRVVASGKRTRMCSTATGIRGTWASSRPATAAGTGRGAPRSAPSAGSSRAVRKWEAVSSRRPERVVSTPWSGRATKAVRVSTPSTPATTAGAGARPCPWEGAPRATPISPVPGTCSRRSGRSAVASTPRARGTAAASGAHPSGSPRKECARCILVVATGEGRFLAAWTEQEGEGPWGFRTRTLGLDPARLD